MESGGWRFDRLLADAYFANSEETTRRLDELELPAPISVFYNAAPAAYFRQPPEVSRRLRRITFITNHLDPALATALDQLSLDIQVERIGLQFRQRLVSPDLTGRSDLLISIGKTTPYALAARMPVYVYDHFGGPGYLTADNFALTARFNFSSRCCERRLDPGELAREITAGYATADAFARTLGDSVLRALPAGAPSRRHARRAALPQRRTCGKAGARPNDRAGAPSGRRSARALAQRAEPAAAGTKVQTLRAPLACRQPPLDTPRRPQRAA